MMDLAELQKKEILGSFDSVNLKPTGDKKFLLFIWFAKDDIVFICI